MRIIIFTIIFLESATAVPPIDNVKDIECEPDEFLCPFGTDKRSGDADSPCIPNTWINDGKSDCVGGYDEKGDYFGTVNNIASEDYHESDDNAYSLYDEKENLCEHHGGY